MEERHEIRWGGFAGIAYAVAAVVGYFLAGQPPRVDDSAGQIASYFADNQNQVLGQSLLLSFAAVCLVAFAAALAQALRERMPGSDVPWVVVTGVVLVAALILTASAVFGTLAFAEMSRPITTAMFTAGSLLMTVIGMAAALALTAASVGIVASEVFPRWIGWFAALCAVLQVIGTFALFNQTGALSAGGPVMGLVPFLVSTLWVLVTSGYMVREHLPTVAAAPPAVGRA